MNININEYLNGEELKEIVIQEVRESIRRHLTEKETARIISNSAYYKAESILDNIVDEQQQEAIVTKVNELINDVSSYNVFRSNYLTGEPESTAAKIVEKTVINNENKIIETTNKIINRNLNEESYENLIDQMMGNMYNGFNISFSKGGN